MTITPLSPDDILAVVRLHRTCLPTTTSSRLGKEYLFRLYETLCRQDRLHLLRIAKDHHQIIGVITVSLDLEQTQLLLRHAIIPRALPSILRGLLLQKLSLSMLLTQMRVEKTLIARFPSPYTGIMTLFVDPSFRRLGIGKKLIKSIEKQLINDQFAELFVDTEERNTKARAFYLSNGFTERQTIEKVVVLSKKLKK